MLAGEAGETAKKPQEKKELFWSEETQVDRKAPARKDQD